MTRVMARRGVRREGSGGGRGRAGNRRFLHFVGHRHLSGRERRGEIRGAERCGSRQRLGDGPRAAGLVKGQSTGAGGNGAGSGGGGNGSLCNVAVGLITIDVRRVESGYHLYPANRAWSDTTASCHGGH